MRFQKGFYLGAATAAHQVEGNNTNSDYWVMENLPGSAFTDPSGIACDHYRRYKEDIDYMKKAGLNAYRFSIEWARIEPEKGRFDEAQVEHYRDVLTYCRENRIEPIVTLLHGTSPKWLISEGGWKAEGTVEYFTRYCVYVVERLGDLMHYVCTLNEYNMGLQMEAIMQKVYKKMGLNLQVGMKLTTDMLPEERKKMLRAQAEAFGVEDILGVHTFMSQADEASDAFLLHVHEAARNAIKTVRPDLKVGATMSLHFLDVLPGGGEQAEKIWKDEFSHYLPVIKDDDFIGVQNYTRSIVGPDGERPVPDGAEVTQMGYEYYPESVAGVIRRVAKDYHGEIFVTENGLATDDDSRRVEFIQRAVKSVQECVEEGVSVVGYLYWSLLDNFEWQSGYCKHFGLIGVNRETMERTPKESLWCLGSYAP